MATVSSQQASVSSPSSSTADSLSQRPIWERFGWSNEKGKINYAIVDRLEVEQKEGTGTNGSWKGCFIKATIIDFDFDPQTNNVLKPKTYATLYWRFYCNDGEEDAYYREYVKWAEYSGETGIVIAFYGIKDTSSFGKNGRFYWSADVMKMALVSDLRIQKRLLDYYEQQVRPHEGLEGEVVAGGPVNEEDGLDEAPF